MSGGGSEITTGSGCRGQAARSACANGGPTTPSASSSMADARVDELVDRRPHALEFTFTFALESQVSAKLTGG